MSRSPNNASDQWLIKSANRVMGPFKLTDVVTGLQLKHFTVMDEISAPFGRWILIRDEQALQSAIKDIRSRSDSMENTATQSHNLTATMSLSGIEMTPSGNPPPVAGSVNTRAVKDLSKLQGKPQKKSSNLFVGVLLLALLVVAGTGYLFLSKKKVKEVTQDYFAQALQLKSQGFYDRSFALLSKVKPGERDNPLIDLEMGTYQIVLQNQNVSGRKLIERVLGQLDDKTSLAQAHTATALSYMNENDFKSALDSLNKALSVDGAFTPALIDRAILDFKNGNPEVAEQDFGPVMDQVNSGIVILGSTLASLEVSRKGLMPTRIQPVLLQMIDEYLKSNFEYQQEAYILKAYIYNSLNQEAKRHEAIMQLLNSDLESGQGHRFELLIDRSILAWKNILPYCQTVVDSGPRDLFNRSLMAYCLAKAGNDLEAKKVILEAEAESPRHSYVAAMKAYIMKSLGQDSEARASLGIALSEREILSAWLMKAKYCDQDGNEACMREALGQLLEMAPRSLPAYSAMAKLELRNKNKKAALDWVSRGLNLSPSFMPFWELKNSL